MKKTITLFALTLSTISFAQTRSESNIAATEVETTALKSAQITEATVATAAPTVYTTEATFKAAIKSDYFLDEFNDCYVTSPPTYHASLIRTTGNYKYTITEAGSTSTLYSLPGAFSTSNKKDSVLITNTGTSVYAFGGFFYNTDTYGAFKAGNIRVTVGTYSYVITTATTSKFVGFVFPEAITSVYIAYPTAQTSTPYCYASMDHFYWGSVATLPTSITNTETTKVSVYPNPTSDVINLSSTVGIQSISITNLAGSEVWSGSASQFPINVSSFAKGIYLVNIFSADGVKTEKVMIK
jgi:hypothetical protein